MRLTKEMKKALSVLCAAAMVVTSVTIPAASSKAAEDTSNGLVITPVSAKYVVDGKDTDLPLTMQEGHFSVNDDGDNAWTVDKSGVYVGHEGNNKDSDVQINYNNPWNDAQHGFGEDFTIPANAVIEVSFKVDGLKEGESFTAQLKGTECVNWGAVDGDEITVDKDGTYETETAVIPVELTGAGTLNLYLQTTGTASLSTQGLPDEAPATETPEATKTPAADGLVITPVSAKYVVDGKDTDLPLTMQEGHFSVNDDGDNAWTVDKSGVYVGHEGNNKDSDVQINYNNPWNDAQHGFGEDFTIPANAVIEVSFKVDGLKEGESFTAQLKGTECVNWGAVDGDEITVDKDGTYETETAVIPVELTGAGTLNLYLQTTGTASLSKQGLPDETPATETPAATETPEATKTPAATSTSAAATQTPATESPATTATAPATQAPAATKAPAAKAPVVVSKISAAKKVVVAPNKSKDVKVTFQNASGASVTPSDFTAESAQKYVTVSTKAGVVTVKAAASAKKQRGNFSKVTIKAGGQTKVVKVYIQNQAKKLKAQKKAVTVKKGKKAKVVIKVTKAQNKKKAITDTVKASVKKVAKVTKTQVKKGKITVTLKATKKGKGTLTVKAGKKSAKVKVTVK